MSKTNAKKLNNLTIEEKFLKVMLDLKVLRPFYTSVFECIEKREANDEIPTMAVTVDTLLYNTDFIESITYSKFLFVVLHEIAHISLRHVSRGIGKHPGLWNIAADFYVNWMLADEFGLYLGATTTIDNISITMPKDALLGVEIDLSDDSTETIYNKLIEQKQERDDKTDDLDSEFDFDENGDKLYKFYFNDNWISHNFQMSETELENYDSDLINKSDKSQEELDAEAGQLIQNAIIKNSLYPSNTHGTESCNLLKQAEATFNSYLNWKTLLKRFLRVLTRSDTSYSKPDKRFMYYSNVVIPGPVENETKNNSIKAVKVCLDVSGSISQSDLCEFLGQVFKICKSYKVSAEAIYWDTNIKSIGEFKDYKSFKDIKIVGGGGTDPSCLFDYFNSKKCKVKPIVTLIFTDGYVDDSFETPVNKKLYDKNTIWIINKDGDKRFKPSFGKVVHSV